MIVISTFGSGHMTEAVGSLTLHFVVFPFCPLCLSFSPQNEEGG